MSEPVLTLIIIPGALCIEFPETLIETKEHTNFHKREGPKMLSKMWETSEKKYNLRVEQNVRISMADGTEINADIFPPDSNEKFPAIFGFSPYFLAPQRAPVTPEAISTHDLMVKRNMKIVYQKEN
jgi:predicted acyl esterase